MPIHFSVGWSCLVRAGWLPIALLAPAVVTVPIWIGFLAGTTGTLFQDLSGIDKHLCGGLALALVAGFVVLGGYGVLERVQVTILAVLLVAVSISAVLMRPDWLAVLGGFVPKALQYPNWLSAAAPKIAEQPIWVEVSLYVGVVGGASYDYIAYVAFLREKHWGLSSAEVPSPRHDLDQLATDPTLLQWLRAPLVDCTLSFLAVVAFSAVFVISGALALSPSHQIPSGDNLLNLQSEFVTQLHPWLYPLYVVGASLTLLGTLYGTNEVAPAMFRELFLAGAPGFAQRYAKRIRSVVIGWGIIGGYIVLVWSYSNHLAGGQGNPPTLVEIVTPAALFTHVSSCALICFLKSMDGSSVLAHITAYGVATECNQPRRRFGVFAGRCKELLGLWCGQNRRSDRRWNAGRRRDVQHRSCGMDHRLAGKPQRVYRVLRLERVAQAMCAAA